MTNSMHQSINFLTNFYNDMKFHSICLAHIYVTSSNRFCKSGIDFVLAAAPVPVDDVDVGAVAPAADGDDDETADADVDELACCCCCCCFCC